MIIKKSLIVSVVLVCLYSILINNLKPEYNTAQNDLQSNIINAQNFLFQDNSSENVIVGTSLSAKLSLNSKFDIYNLSFAGGGIFDGLSILSQKKEVPERIFIEINYIERRLNSVIKDVVENRESQFIKKILPIAREENQPVGLLVGRIFSLFDKVEPRKNQNAEMINRLVSSEAEKNNISVLPEIVMSNMKLLKEYIDFFETQGSTIVFYEMPTHPKVCGAVYPTNKRELFYDSFPKKKYAYIDQPSCSGIQTSDGRHLTEEELDNYKNYFIRSIQPLYENN